MLLRLSLGTFRGMKWEEGMVSGVNVQDLKMRWMMKGGLWLYL